MEVKSANDGLLTNAEVLTVLRERQSAREQRKAQQEDAPANSMTYELNVANQLEKEVIGYIESTPAGKVSYEGIREKLIQVKELGHGELTEGEMIQLANHCPAQAVEVHLYIEECAERFDSEGVDSLIAVFADQEQQ